MEKKEQPTNVLAANPNPEELYLYRTDMWWISNEYLTLGANMVALQLIPGEERFNCWEALAERVEYVLRQHCPVVYSYLFDNHDGVGAIPAGFVNVVKQIAEERYPNVLTLVGDDNVN